MKRVLYSLYALLAVCVAFAGNQTFTVVNRGIFATPAAGIVTDGLIGNSSVLDVNARTNNILVYSSFTTTTAGQITYCGTRIDPVNISDDFTLGIYDTSGNLLSHSNLQNAGNSLEWKIFTLSTPIEISASTQYIIGIVGNVTNFGVSKDGTESGHYRRTIPMTYDVTPDATADFSSGNYTSISESSVHNFMCQNDSTIP